MPTQPTEMVKRLDVQDLEINHVKVTATAAELNILDGAALTTAELNKLAGLTPSKEELNVLDGVAASASFVIGAETGGNTINVGVQIKDANGADIGTRQQLRAYLSDDANGDSIAGTAPSGGVAIGTDGLAIPVVAGKAFLLTTEADGDIDLNVVEAGVATWYLIIVMPNGKLAPSGAITFA